MDAIIIACATRNHVNYLSNESASKHARIARYDLHYTFQGFPLFLPTDYPTSLKEEGCPESNQTRTAHLITLHAIYA